MIWSDPIDAVNSREALRCDLATQMAAAYGDSVPEHVGEIAAAVAAFCTRPHDDFSVSSDYFAFLLSRALRAVGEEQTALALGADRSSPAVEAATQFRNVPPALWSAFSARLIRPSRWLVDSGRQIWVLDFSRFRLDANLCLELAFHQAIRAILYAVAEIWDSTAGDGCLGLRGINSCGRSLREVRSLCVDLLEQIGAKRGWASMPRVLNLDIEH